MINSLVMCSYYPLPENLGAHIRTMNFVRALKAIGKVEIAYSGCSDPSKLNNGIFSNEYHLENMGYPTSTLLRLCCALRNTPYPINIFKGRNIEHTINLINSGYYDCVVIRGIQNTGILRYIARSKRHVVIADIDDIITGSLYNTLFDDTNNITKACKRFINKTLLIAYQKKLFSRFKTIFCSESDKRMHATNNESAYVLPNIYDNRELYEHVYGDGYLNQNVLLFVGMLSYPPNINGLRWFIDNIYMKFYYAFQDAKLLVVGRKPTDDVISMCGKHNSIHLYPDAISLIPYYEMARAVVVPLLNGGGTRIKILEAGLTRRPVLSTPIGAYGLEAQDGKDILLFNNSDDFIQRYEQLQDKNYYETVSQSLLNLVTNKYSRRSFANSFYRVLGHGI